MSPRTATAPPPASGPALRAGRTVPMALKLVRGRISGLLAVAVAVAGGAAFVTVGGVLADTGLRSHMPVERLPGADVVVAAPQSLPQAEDIDVALPERTGLPNTLVEQLGSLPEADAAVGDIGFPAAVHTPDGVASGPDPRTAGRGWSSTALLDPAEVTGAAPQSAHDVVLDTATARGVGAEVGDQLRITVAGRTGDYRLSGIVDAAGSGIFFADATAARLAGRTSGPREATVDLIGLRAAPGVSDDALADAVRDSVNAAGGTKVAIHSGASRADAEVPAAASARMALIGLAGSFSGVVLVIVGFTVAGALSVSVAAQRRDLALLRMVGATPRQIRTLVAVPNLLTTLAVLPVGIAAGYLSADRVHSLLAGLGLFPASLPVRLGVLPAVAAAVLLSLTVWLSARAAASRTAMAAPTAALAQTMVEPRAPRPWRARTGAALLLASTVLSVPPLLIASELGMAGTAAASLMAVIGLALAGPALVRAVSGALARRLPAAASPLTWLAVQNLHGHAYRVAGAVASLAMAVAFTLGQGYAHTTLLTAKAVQQEDGELADHRMSAPGLGGLPDGLAASVRGLPGVAAATTTTPTSVVWRDREWGGDTDTLEELPARVVGPGAAEVLDLGVTEGDLDRLTGTAIALGASFARLHGAEVGDSVAFHMGDGAAVRADVVALYERELGHGPLMLSRDLAFGHVTGDLDADLLVRAEPGHKDQVHTALTRVAKDHPGVDVSALAAAPGPSAGGIGDIPAEMVVNVVVLLALLGYLLLAVANRLAAQTLQRGREVDTLCAIGMTPDQVRSLLRRESAMIAVGAVGAGVAAAAVPLALAGLGFLGRPWPGGPVWLLPVTALVVALLAWLCVELPARRLTAAPARR
ncbi:MAG: ABC transporter permease [Nocardiopsaceae bacterium]|nr:ABC transporter permease [Nocardiopsaceae bacterium]